MDLTIDITTVGRNSGSPRKLEIWFHRAGDRYYITGQPGKRNCYANLTANPDFTFHLKESAQADLPATAAPVTDPDEKRRVFLSLPIFEDRERARNIDDWVAGSPLIEVVFK